jgi:copper chaperone CopZ
MTATYTITGMHCGGCVAKVKAALQQTADSVHVTLDPPEVVLTGPKVSSLAALNTAVAAAGGYRLEPKVLVPDPVRAGPAALQEPPANWLATYKPLLIIAGFITLASFAGTTTAAGIDWPLWMTHFMAGFFLVFSAFKFLDLNGFATAYATYDLLAKRWLGYGYIYPFFELGLGLAYLFRFAPTATHITTVVLMGFSSLGVLAALREKRTIQCACLGTVLKLPMSTITLVEDLGMAGMAAAALIIAHG